MSFNASLAVLLIFSAACYFAIGLRLVVSKRDVGTMPIGVLLLIIGFWVAGGAIELMSSTFFVFSMGRTLHFVGTAFLPVAAYVCFREYTGRRTSVHRVTMMLIIPIVSVSLAATNIHHEFMWYLPVANSAGEYLTRPGVWGPWFLFVHAPYSYAVMGVAVLTLLVQSSAVARSHRRGLFLLVAACIGPLTATLAYDLGYGPNTISFVPIVFTLMLPIYAWLILGEQIVEFTPLAYETVFQNMQDPVVVVDDQGRIIGLNQRAEILLEITETGALLEPLKQVLGSDTPEVFEALETGEPRKIMTATGRFLHVQVSPMASHRPARREGKVLMFRDVSDVEIAQAEVRSSEKLLRTLIDHSVNGILRMRWEHEDGQDYRELRCIFANAMAGRFLNAERDELIDCSGEQVVKIATNAMGEVDASNIISDFRRATEAGESMDVEVNHVSNGSNKWLRMICEPFGTDIAVTFVDITDSKAKEQHMESIARSDPLTGVLNRRGFERDASKRLSDSPDDATGALLFIDLNEFKQINDSKGHEIGDQLLRIAAQRLRKSLRSCDIIGRPGGDEFVALVPDVSPEVAERLASRLATALEEPYLIGEDTLSCAASIGLALYPKNANTLTGLLREADQAMYRAKARCRGVANIRSADLLEKAM
ncbi:MAG: diguanylate cyclase [Gammaproteobacteria bacterium]|nr:diguanylate cyclase [Gammaproteobacteria bacterium]MDH3409128.1 diguanylate cyclase [Gammaproteobacteria bacterium]